MKNLKTALLYLLLHSSNFFVLSTPLSTPKPAINVLLSGETLLFVSLHLRLATPLFSFKLVDLFSYETTSSVDSHAIISYIFTNVVPPSTIHLFSKTRRYCTKIPSISTVFSASTWLERELTEMSNSPFLGKLDTRNLMLPYGDSSNPLQKSLPSIGLREIFYDSSVDAIMSRPVSIQY